MSAEFSIFTVWRIGFVGVCLAGMKGYINNENRQLSRYNNPNLVLGHLHAMKKLLLCSIILFILSLSNAFAVKVSSLYQAEVPVASQTEDLKQQAVEDGFQQVLIKLTGNPQIASNPVIRSSLQRADYYVQEYSYMAPTPDASEYMLQVRYDADDVNRLLKHAGASFWGESRPLLLVWLTVRNDANDVEIVASEAPGGEYAAMKQQSRKFGIPLIFPMMDMDDINKVSVDDVSHMNVSLLSEAAKRYSPDAILIGNIQTSKAGAGVQGKWRLVLGDTNWDWSTADKSMPDDMATIMNFVSQTLAKNYIVKSANTQSQILKLQVSNVFERNDLALLMQYLKQITPVERVDLAQVSGNVVALTVAVNGPVDGFLKNATIGQHLVLKSQDQGSNSYVYEWVR